MNDLSNEAFERVRLARHPERPYSLDIIENIGENFLEMHGDRRFADDPAMLCGLLRIGETDFAVIGQQKGRDTSQRRYRNFGMPKPEGYRKALRMAQFAEKFGLGIITLVDTPGAYPGIDAEERGQAEAIAFNLREFANLKVPVIVIVIGEGGSGGALAIGIGDVVLMLENAVYSVITPEGCAAILWKDAGRAPDAAHALKMTAGDLQNMNIIDEVIAEPTAWRVEKDEKKEESAAEKSSAADSFSIYEDLRGKILNHYAELSAMPLEKLLTQRYQKLRALGSWEKL